MKEQQERPDEQPNKPQAQQPEGGQSDQQESPSSLDTPQLADQPADAPTADAPPVNTPDATQSETASQEEAVQQDADAESEQATPEAAEPNAVNDQITDAAAPQAEANDAEPTVVDGQITDAVTQSSGSTTEAEPAEPTAVDGQITDAVADAAADTTGDSADDTSTEATTVNGQITDAVEQTTEGTGTATEEQGSTEEEHEEEEVDYSNMDRQELYNALEQLEQSNDVRRMDKGMRVIKELYDQHYNKLVEAALAKFKEEGGEEGDFEYSPDELHQQFTALHDRAQERRRAFFKDQENQREKNLATKEAILEELRQLIDGEETTTSINVIKEIQQRWKAVGPVAPSQNKTLWANYNALLDRFYDNRSIYFELKELDRKKNLSAKQELCVRAEKLLEAGNFRDAIKELNELHEEFKHIGPVPKEEQEALWQRFKAASDKLYEKRKEYSEALKKELFANMEKKKELGKKLEPYATFTSDRINQWNAKTREILDLQKEWDAIGRLPRDHAKEVNKSFWTAFKAFFHNKSQFFKRLEAERDENLKKKEALVEQANELKESDNFDETAKKLKELQKEWKAVGPVPEKQREEVYQRFKEACDHFFDRRRSNMDATQQEYVDNLRKKEDICKQISALKGSAEDIETYKGLMDEYAKVGFVPKGAIKKIQSTYEDAINGFLKKTDLSDAEKAQLNLEAQINRVKGGPNASRKLFQTEQRIRKQIDSLNNDINQWKTNIEFFARSKEAERIRAEFDAKIEAAQKELGTLKQQLRTLKKGLK